MITKLLISFFHEVATFQRWISVESFNDPMERIIFQEIGFSDFALTI